MIPEKQKPHGRKRGRPPGFDRELDRRRNALERCVGWLKQTGASVRRDVMGTAVEG